MQWECQSSLNHKNSASMVRGGEDWEVCVCIDSVHIVRWVSDVLCVCVLPMLNCTALDHLQIVFSRMSIAVSKIT